MTMHQYGDQAKPVWAVEMGWNALPANWKGNASPWGTDSEAQQAAGSRAHRANASRVELGDGNFPAVSTTECGIGQSALGFFILEFGGCAARFC